MRNLWTKEENLLLQELCEKGESSYGEMVKFFKNRTEIGIKSHASFLKIKSNYDYHRKYYYDENFWNSPNKINTFYSGWIASDGCIMNLSKNRYAFSCAQHPKDKYLIEWFKRDAKIDSPIVDSIKKQGWEISSMRLNVYDDWAIPLKDNFSITPRKTHTLQPPNISEDLIPYYLIGFVHGDGCWHMHKMSKLLSLSFASASFDILNWINKWVTNNFKSKYYQGKGQNVIYFKNNYKLTISGNAAEQLHSYLISLGTPLLKRKWFNPKFGYTCNIQDLDNWRI